MGHDRACGRRRRRGGCRLRGEGRAMRGRADRLCCEGCASYFFARESHPGSRGPSRRRQRDCRDLPGRV